MNFFKNQPGSNTNTKVPQRLQINGRQIQEDKLLGEGAFAFIWLVHDVSTNQKFALKKMFCPDSERLKTAQREMNILKKMPQSDNLMRFYDGQFQQTGNGQVALFLLELCSDGSLFDMMSSYSEQDRKFSEQQIIQILKEISNGLKVMHSMYPPYAHRDIKIENVLLNQKRFKLCDFGSVSTQDIDFSQIKEADHYDYDEQFEKCTTPMYRPPEMIDFSKKYRVNQQVDVWMLGCVIFTLCYFRHPFLDSSKYAIVDASFKIPDDSSYSNKLHNLIYNMLTPNPSQRLTINKINELATQYNSLSSIPLNPGAKMVVESHKNYSQSLQNLSKQTLNFDGDIPIEELEKLKLQILNEEKNKNTKKVTKNPQPAQKKDAPIKKQPIKQQPQNIHKQQNQRNIQNDFNAFDFNPFGNSSNQKGNGNSNNNTWDAFPTNQNNKSKQSSNAFDNFFTNENQGSTQQSNSAWDSEFTQPNNSNTNNNDFGNWGFDQPQQKKTNTNDWDTFATTNNQAQKKSSDNFDLLGMDSTPSTIHGQNGNAKQQNVIQNDDDFSLL